MPDELPPLTDEEIRADINRLSLIHRSGLAGFENSIGLRALRDLLACREALRDAGGKQAQVLAFCRTNGFVFDDIEGDGWQKFAFSLYSDLCEINESARAVRGDPDGE